jgi:hypothetical protein
MLAAAVVVVDLVLAEELAVVEAVAMDLLLPSQVAMLLLKQVVVVVDQVLLHIAHFFLVEQVQVAE